MLSSVEDNMKKFEWKNELQFLRVIRMRTEHHDTRCQKSLVSFFLPGCSYSSLPSARTQNRCISSGKTKQKKETSEKPNLLGEPGTFQEPHSKPPRFLFLPHFENVKRSKPFKNLQEVLERFQVPRGFQRVSVDIFRVTGWSTQEPQNSSAVLFSSCTARLGILSTDSESLE